MMITDIEDYFTRGCGRCPRFATPDCSTRFWIEGQTTLRRICREAGLAETVKWAHPTYVHAGRNIAIMGAFRDDYRLTLFDAALLEDPEGVLERQGPNSRHADAFRFTDNAGPAALEPVIRAYLAEAMAYAEQGIRPPKQPSELDLPDEIIDAMDSDPELAEAFHALTPGRQKSYEILLKGLKKPESRIARIEKVRDKILAGRGAMER